jgi:uncharacterized coiled-coil DUF342 family protein
MAELKDLLEERRKMVDKKATQHREVRDDWNEKTKQFTTTRNELNNEVRELIVQVREQRDLRDQMNEMVREKMPFEQLNQNSHSSLTAVADRFDQIPCNPLPAPWSALSENLNKESTKGRTSENTSRK